MQLFCVDFGTTLLSSRNHSRGSGAPTASASGALEATIGPEWTGICFVLHALHKGRECKLAHIDNIAPYSGPEYNRHWGTKPQAEHAFLHKFWRFLQGWVHH